MSAEKFKKVTLSTRKRLLYEKNAEIIAYYRRNPVIACEDLLGIKLLDNQKWQLQMSWNKPYVLWACSRNAGKSFLGAILMILKGLLYENQAIYIFSTVGDQAKETFGKIEEIVLRMGSVVNSIDGLKDIVLAEVVTSPACQTGFSHNPSSFHVEFYNGSEINTLNSNADGVRGKRATLVFFDEAGFISEEGYAAVAPFTSQDSNFKTSVSIGFNIKAQYKKVPTQLVYASSASHVDTTFFSKYKDFAKQMFLGNRDYFCCDISCEIPLDPTIDGKPCPPLLQKSKVDSEMRANKEKALREYYNIFTTDGGADQIVKWGTIRRNETYVLPELSGDGKSKYAIAIDPARTFDNSIMSTMKICYSKDVGYYGEIVNCLAFIDLTKKKKMQMKTPDQIAKFKEDLLGYNTEGHPDYENISGVLIDSGSGGGGKTAWADNILADWADKKGRMHKGFLDCNDDTYKEEAYNYPNASNILNMVSPGKYRTQMVQELIELMDLDLIKFPKEYDNRDYIVIPQIIDGEEKLVKRRLSVEEQIALINIDIMKTETTYIQKFTNDQNTNIKYALSKEKENKVHDDRFYTLIMLAHHLYELRRKDLIGRAKNNSHRFLCLCN